MPAALAGTVFLFACGSSSIPEVARVGRPTRWLALLVLLAVAIVYARRNGRGPLRSAPLYVLAAALTGLALLSSLWTADPRLTAARAISLGILLVIAGALAWGTRGREEHVRRILLGILAGAMLVALAGIPALLFAYDQAVQPASPGSPWRLRGLGENANTVPVLAALALPVALWLLGESLERRRQLAFGASAALLFGAIVAAGSQGALLAVLFGAGLLAVTLPRTVVRRATATVAVVAFVTFGVALRQLSIHLPPPLPEAELVAGGRTALSETTVTRSRAKGSRTLGVTEDGATAGVGATATGGGSSGGEAPERPSEGSKPRPARPPVEPVAATKVFSITRYPVSRFDEIGNPFFAGRVSEGQTRLGSGRLLAWRGAFEQGLRRPLLGYGFGTEERVFVDRYYVFQGSRPENSYLGIFLQLGAAGALLLAGIALILLATIVRALRVVPRSSRGVAAACSAVVLVGLGFMCVQSYVYSVGNIGTLTFWVSSFLLAALGARPAVTASRALALGPRARIRSGVPRRRALAG